MPPKVVGNVNANEYQPGINQGLVSGSVKQMNFKQGAASSPKDSYCVSDTNGNCLMFAQKKRKPKKKAEETKQADTPPPPPPKKQITTCDIKLEDKEIYELIVKLVSGNFTEEDTKKMESLVPGLRVSGANLHEIIFKLSVERLKCEPESAEKYANNIILMLNTTGTSSEFKLERLKELVQFHNAKESDATQKKEILKIFDKTKESDNPALFSLGMQTVKDLNDDGHAMMQSYVSTFIDHAAKESKIGKDPAIADYSLETISKYASVEQKKMGELIDETVKFWFKNKKIVPLWKAIMVMANTEGRIPGEEGAQGQRYFEAVQMTFKKYYGDDTQKRVETSKWVVKHMAVSYPLPNQSDLSITDFHLQLLEEMISEGPEEVRHAIVSELNGLPNEENQHGVLRLVDEKAVLWCYFNLMRFPDTREKVIVDSTKFKKLHTRLIKYLIDTNQARNIRNPSHAFLVDDQPIGPNLDAPIEAFGIKLIRPVEKTCSKAKENEIKNQCNNTIDTLYVEYRRHKPLLDIEIVGVTRSINSLSGAAINLAQHGGTLNIDFLSKPFKKNKSKIPAGGRNSQATRFLLGGYADAAQHLLGFGLRVGFAAEFGKSVMLKVPFRAGYLRINGAKSNLPGIPFVWGEQDANGVYPLINVTPTISFQGGEVGAAPELVFTMKRFRLGGGKTLGLNLVAGAFATVGYGKLSDKPVANTLERLENLGITEDQQIVGQGVFGKTRSNQSAFTYSLGLFAGFTVDLLAW